MMLLIGSACAQMASAEQFVRFTLNTNTKAKDDKNKEVELEEKTVIAIPESDSAKYIMYFGSEPFSLSSDVKVYKEDGTPITILRGTGLTREQPEEKQNCLNKPESNENKWCDFFSVSLIKTVSGVAPTTEFLDVNAFFSWHPAPRYPRTGLAILGNLEIPNFSQPSNSSTTTTSTSTSTSSSTSTTSSSSTQNISYLSGYLGFHANWLLLNYVSRLYAGTMFTGSGVSFVAPSTSPLAGSYFGYGNIESTYPQKDIVFTTRSDVIFDRYTYAEVLLHGENKRVPFINNFQVRVSVLWPDPKQSAKIVNASDANKPTEIKSDNKDMKFRLIFEVPIGGVFYY